MKPSRFSIPAVLKTGVTEHKAGGAQPSSAAPPAAVKRIPTAYSQAYQITNTDVPPQGFTLDIPIDLIEPDPHQPRVQEEFDEARINSLADSLKAVGQIDALKVYAPEVAGGKFVLSGGEYRWKAGKKAELPALRCHVVPREAELMVLRRAAIANEQRSDHGPVSRARLFTKLQSLGMNQKEIAADMGWNKARVSEIMTVAKLPDEVLGLAAEKGWGLEALLHLARANDADRATMLSAAAESGVLKSRTTESVRKQRKAAAGGGEDVGRGGEPPKTKEKEPKIAAPAQPQGATYAYRSSDGFHVTITGGRAKKETITRVLSQASRDWAADKGWTEA